MGTAQVLHADALMATISPRGDFGKRSSAEQVAEGINLAGKTILVTGANSGVGLESARVFVKQGATVIMGCRSLDRGNAAEASGTDALKIDTDALIIRPSSFDLDTWRGTL